VGVTLAWCSHRRALSCFWRRTRCSSNRFFRNNAHCLAFSRQRFFRQTSRNFAKIAVAVGGGRPNKSSASQSELRARSPSAEIRSRRSPLLLFRKAAPVFARSSSAPDARSRSARNLSFLISLAGNAAECRRGHDRFDRSK